LDQTTGTIISALVNLVTSFSTHPYQHRGWAAVRISARCIQR
jgi:hypothetical protein